MYIRTKDGIYKVEGETCHNQGYFIDRYRDTKGTKDNPYIYICHPREYEIWKSKLNLDENDMYVSADGWVKVVKTPENMFHSKVYKLYNR